MTACWWVFHRWGNWSEPIAQTKGGVVQLRTCGECGKIEVRWL